MAAQNAAQPHLPVQREDAVPPQQIQSPMPIGAVRPAPGTGRPDPRSVGADQSTNGGS